MRGIFVDALPHSKYTKIVNRSTAKSIFESMYSTYEGNKHIKEVKANQLVHQYELFRMKEMNILKPCTQTFVCGLQVLNKSYYVLDYVKKILRSLSVKFRQKVTTIHVAKDLNKLSLENLINSLKSHEIELVGDEHAKKSKSIALTSKGKSAKALQATESKEETP